MNASKFSANSAILKYLTESNRPYSVNDIVNNLHKEYGKTAVTKALEMLVEQGNVIEKTYGKQKVYIRNQSDLSVPIEKLTGMDTRIDDLSKQLKALQKELKEKSFELDALNSSFSLAQLNEKIKYCEKQHSDLKPKANLIKQKVGNMIADDFKKSQDELQRRSVTWKTRKRVAHTSVDALLEVFPQKKKALLEEIGVDED